MWSFITRHLDPATRLGEVLFGLIMTLGITGAVRLGLEQADNRELFIAVLGCNLAWGVVDGVMFAMLALFERGRKARIVTGVLRAPTDEAAILRIGEEFDDRLKPLTTPEEREQIYRWMLEPARRSARETPGFQRRDVLGGIAVAGIIMLATLPVVVPFLLVSNPTLAVRLSNLTALALQFLAGCWWGRLVGASPFRVGAGLTCVGGTLVLVTIALGG